MVKCVRVFIVAVFVSLVFLTLRYHFQGRETENLILRGGSAAPGSQDSNDGECLNPGASSRMDHEVLEGRSFEVEPTEITLKPDDEFHQLMEAIDSGTLQEMADLASRIDDLNAHLNVKWHAVFCQNIAKVEWLVSHGLKGISPLQLSVMKGDLRTVQMEFARAPDWPPKDELTWSEVYHLPGLAASWNHWNIVAWLADQGVSMNIRGGLIPSPLHVAVERGNKNAAEWLLQRGASVNMIDERSNTPLMRAILHRHPDIIQLLLNFGADVNFQDCHGVSPLAQSIYADDAKTIRLLLMRGADSTVRTPDMRYPIDHERRIRGITLLELAQITSTPEIVGILKGD